MAVIAAVAAQALGKDLRDEPGSGAAGGLGFAAKAFLGAQFRAGVEVVADLVGLDCGRAAGARTVLVNMPENPWPELADWHAQDCVALRQMLSA